MHNAANRILLKLPDFTKQILCAILFALHLCLPRPLTCFFPYLKVLVLPSWIANLVYPHIKYMHIQPEWKTPGILLLHYTSGHVLQQKWDCAHGKQIINDEWGKTILIVSDLKAIIDSLYSNPFICSWESRHPLFSIFVEMAEMAESQLWIAVRKHNYLHERARLPNELWI